MPDYELKPYTVEELQQEYPVNLPQAVEVLDRFGETDGRSKSL